MPGKEIGLIAALFLPSLIITWVGTVMIVKAMAYVWPQAKADEPEEDNNADVLESDSESGESSKRNRSRNNSQASIGSQVSRHHHHHHHHHHPEDSVLATVEAGQSAHPAPSLTSPRSPNSLIELHSPTEPPPPPPLTEKNPNLTLDNNLTLCATEVVEEKENRSDPEKVGDVRIGSHELSNPTHSRAPSPSFLLLLFFF
jgi:hypothetical protein